MRYTLRALLCLLLALCLALPLTACDGGSWRDDLTAAQLSPALGIDQCLQIGSAAGYQNSNSFCHYRITFSSPLTMLPMT